MAKTIEYVSDASYLTNGYLDTVLDWIPGLEGIRLKDLPSFLRTANPDDFVLRFMMEETQRARKASAIIINTYQPLEHGVLDALSSYLPPIYTIGPLHFLDNHVHDKSLPDIQSNLWKEEPECLEWLDSKDPNSVVYVNFGSIAILSQAVLLFCQVSFLKKPKKEACLQAVALEKVLSHPSVGGFLTHSGWNSTIESISYGVPLFCWPFFADQQTNCWFCCTKWGIGMELDNNVKRDEIESLVSELMAGEKGKEMKKKAMDWKKLAEMAVTEFNSNLENLIHQVLLNPSI
nr:7-deoxyloganetin glucosyltransferase-like [Coffea arabica]